MNVFFLDLDSSRHHEESKQASSLNSDRYISIRLNVVARQLASIAAAAMSSSSSSCIWASSWSGSLKRLLRGRWMGVAVSFYMLLFSGATYIFGVYSGAIKSALHYNQETIDSISFFKDLGGNVGILAGLMNEVSPPWMVLSVGAALNLFGYLMIWLSVTHRVAAPSAGAISFYMYAAANSQTFANTAVLVACVKNFPLSRGIVLGLTKGCIGLSGAVFVQIYHAIYGQDNSADMILFLAWLPSLIILLFMFFVRRTEPDLEEKHERHFFFLLYLALALAGFLTLAIILENALPQQLPAEAYTVFGAATVLLVASNALVAVRAECEGRRKGIVEEGVDLEGEKAGMDLSRGRSGEEKKKNEGSEEVCRRSDLGEEKEDGSGRWRCYWKKRRWAERGEDHSIAEAMVSLDMWILLVSVTCGVGGSLAAVDNMGQIGESLGYSKVSISTCVSLISIWNFVGRVSAGFGSEHLLRRYRVSRALVLSLILGLSSVGHLLIAFPAPGALYAASVLVGFCFGAIWPPLYALISEIFGLKYFATLYNVVGSVSPLGSYLLNVKVAGHLYDREARRQAQLTPASDLACYGTHCFRMAFSIIAIASFAGSLISLLLVIRTRQFYSHNIYAKYHAQQQQQQQRQQNPHQSD